MSGAYAGLRLSARVQNGADPEADDDTDPGEMPGDDEKTTESTSKKKDKSMTTSTDQAALNAARAEGFAEASTRSSAVLASEHYVGRENLAQTLLGNDKLSAEEITTALASAPKIEPSALATDNDEQARAELRKGLAASQPAATSEADEVAAAAAAKANNHGWDDVHAEVRESRGL